MDSGTKIFSVAKAIVEQLEFDLAGTPAGRPMRACVVPGTIAWDECECGTLAVAIARQFITDTFPANAGDVTFAGTCRSGFMAADLVVQIIRCAPQPSENQIAPSCSALEECALQVSVDAWTVLNGTQCLLQDMSNAGSIVDYIVRSQIMQGPEGACVGSELTVTVAVEQEA